MAWWRHKFVIVRIVKIYFMDLLMSSLVVQLTMLSYKDKILIKNLWQCKGFTARRLMKEFPNKNWKRRTLEDYVMNFGNVWWPSGKTWSNMWLTEWQCYWLVATSAQSVCPCKGWTLWTQPVNKHCRKLAESLLLLNNKTLWWVTTKFDVSCWIWRFMLIEGFTR